MRSWAGASGPKKPGRPHKDGEQSDEVYDHNCEGGFGRGAWMVLRSRGGGRKLVARQSVQLRLGLAASGRLRARREGGQALEYLRAVSAHEGHVLGRR